MTELLFKELTGKIIGTYYDVYNGTSRTYPEFVYEKAMLYDLRRKQIECQRQEEYQIFYKDCSVGFQRLDLFTSNEIIIEIKVSPCLSRLHRAQTFSYLKAFGKKIGLLFNFGRSKPEFERRLYVSQLPKCCQEEVERTTTELPEDLLCPELAYQIVGGLYTVHNHLGPGFIHRIYANACLYEFRERGMPVYPQKDLQVVYRGESIASIKFDHLRVDDMCLVFPVAIGNIHALSINNLKDWLRVEQIPLGIIVNFHDIALKPIFLRI